MGRIAVAVATLLLSALFLHSTLAHDTALRATIERVAERSAAETMEPTELKPLETPGSPPAPTAQHFGIPASGQLQLTAPALEPLEKSVAAAFEPPADTLYEQLARERHARSPRQALSPVALSIIRC